MFCWHLLGRRSRSAWFEVGGTARSWGEAQHVGLAVAQDLQQQPGLAFAGAGAVSEGVGQPDQHAVSEPGDQLGAGVVGDRGQAALQGDCKVVR